MTISTTLLALDWQAGAEGQHRRLSGTERFWNFAQRSLDGAFDMVSLFQLEASSSASRCGVEEWRRAWSMLKRVEPVTACRVDGEGERLVADSGAGQGVEVERYEAKSTSTEMVDVCLQRRRFDRFQLWLFFDNASADQPADQREERVAWVAITNGHALADAMAVSRLFLRLIDLLLDSSTGDKDDTEGRLPPCLAVALRQEPNAERIGEMAAVARMPVSRPGRLHLPLTVPSLRQLSPPSSPKQTDNDRNSCPAQASGRRSTFVMLAKTAHALVRPNRLTPLDRQGTRHDAILFPPIGHLPLHTLPPSSRRRNRGDGEVHGTGDAVFTHVQPRRRGARSVYGHHVRTYLCRSAAGRRRLDDGARGQEELCRCVAHGPGGTGDVRRRHDRHGPGSGNVSVDPSSLDPQLSRLTCAYFHIARCPQTDDGDPDSLLARTPRCGRGGGLEPGKVVRGSVEEQPALARRARLVAPRPSLLLTRLVSWSLRPRCTQALLGRPCSYRARARGRVFLDSA
uniref:Putative acetyltransferase n=1 Tax=Pseudozyma flocculosa TaxID=84751 RepID=E2JKE7_9BASI|nr:putative acetyltransferase [Pseudozyma flocculosa]